MHQRLKKGFLFFIICFIWASLAAAKNDSEKKEEPPSIGNFSLPASQQPGGLVSFGQNILDKGHSQYVLEGNYFGGVNNYELEVIPNVVYAITDSFSVNFLVPIIVRAQEAQHRSSGFEDIGLQFEYALYTKDTLQLEDQATIVLRGNIPSGSADKDPPTGVGWYSLFLGGTFVRTYVDWLLFTSYGINWTIAHQGTKFGNSFLYQGGVGKNICYAKDKYIFSWLIEVDGQYSQRNRLRGIIDPDSGGNIVYVTPSLWYSTKTLALQAGVGVPVTQHLLGNQLRNNYLVIASITWTV